MDGKTSKSPFEDAIKSVKERERERERADNSVDSFSYNFYFLNYCNRMLGYFFVIGLFIVYFLEVENGR